MLRRSCLGNQRLFEVLAERGLQRVELARRGIGQIGFENLLNPGGPLFLVALELPLVGPESDRQYFLGLDLGHKWKDFEEAFLLLQNGKDLFFYDTNEFVFLLHQRNELKDACEHGKVSFRVSNCEFDSARLLSGPVCGIGSQSTTKPERRAVMDGRTDCDNFR